MVIVVGLLLLAFGLYLAFISWPAILGALSLACLCGGAIAFIVGFSERRARNDYEQAIDEAADSGESRKGGHAVATEK